MPEPTFRMQPCVSPVWDTAQALFALGEAGVPRTDPRMLKAADWLLSKEVRHKGDWAVKVPKTEPGGWYFEFNNEFYPDTDDTAQVLLALSKVDNPRERYQHQVVQRAIDWDFRHAVPERRLGQLRQRQHEDDLPVHPVCGSQRDARSADRRHYGAHAGDAGLLWVHARGQACGEGHQIHPERAGAGWKLVRPLGRQLHLRHIPGASRTGRDRVRHNEPQVQQAAEWIRMVQNSDGGWGETCGSYDDPNTRGVGPSTPSQTAWALLGLLAAGDDRSDSIAKGVRWLLERQLTDGSWDESMGEGAQRKASSRAQDFQRSSIWHTRCTGSTSRSWR